MFRVRRSVACEFGAILVLATRVATSAASESVEIADGGSDARSYSAADATSGVRDGIFQPGTQPLELSVPLRSPELCDNCHGGYADYAANDTWKGTMMANAARDPLFHAALTIANQDEPGAGDICIRCHAPRAWLFGRSEPGHIDKMEDDDFESVQCDFCHRLTGGPDDNPYIGNARYFVANDFIRRGPMRHPSAPHGWQFAPYFEDSRLCGLCHDVTNPLRGNFPIERTYTEWLSSAYAAEGKSCQSCHMPEQMGVACGAPGTSEHAVHRHEFAGGNYWMPRVLKEEHPELDRDAAYAAAIANAERGLHGAASLRLDVPAHAKAGERFAFVVRVENLTGHKLPTGYPDGRRMWLDVELKDEQGVEIFHSGAYDTVSAMRSTDPQLRTYEVRMAANGKEGFHFVLEDELLQDNRLPPRGFVPTAETAPVGRNYLELPSPDGGPSVLAHWDEAPYAVTLPTAVRGTVVIRATLRYQTTSREFVEALQRENVTDDYGRRMLELWQKYDRAPPLDMVAARTTVEIEAASPPERSREPKPETVPEAGPEAPDDAAASDAGCACGLVRRREDAWPAWITSALLAVAAARTHRAQRRRAQ